MAGRHDAARGLRLFRTRAVLAGAVLAALALVLAGGVVTGWSPGGTPGPTAAAGPETAGPETAGDPRPDRAVQRPSRGGVPRAVAPQDSPSPDPEPEREPEPAEPAAPEPAPGDPEPVPDSGDVVTTGTCEASFYWEPQPTASGEVFDPEAMTAAHKTWDFDTRVRVTNPANGESVVVRINDRGPYIDGRCLDLARGAFREIAALDNGVVTVTYEVLSD